MHGGVGMRFVGNQLGEIQISDPVINVAATTIGDDNSWLAQVGRGNLTRIIVVANVAQQRIKDANKYYWLKSSHS